MSASALNMQAIVEARDQHNARCRFPAHTVLVHPVDLERLGWEDGDRIAGLTVAAEPEHGTGAFTLLCDRDQVTPFDEAVGEAVSVRPLVPA